MGKKKATKRTKRTGAGWQLSVPAVRLLPVLTATTRHRYRRRWEWALGAAVALELLIGVGLFLWTQPVRQINLAGVYSGRSLNSERLAAKLNQAAADYRLLVRYPDKSMRAFSLRDMGMSVDRAATLTAARAAQHQGNLFQHGEWWQTTFVPLSLQIDQPVFERFVNSHVTFAATQPQDARLAIDNGKIMEAEGVDGLRYDMPDSAARIRTAAQGLDRTPLTPSSQNTPPQIMLANLREPKKRLESILGQHVNFRIEGKVTAVPRATVGTWIEIIPVPEKHTVDITVNGGKVQNFINQLAANYSHSPRTQVMTASESGTTVLVAGRDGADIRGRDALAATAVSQLLRANGVDMDLPVSHTPHKTITAQAYPKWIEVDLTTKRLYAYETATLVREVLVSAGAAATPTVTGQFAIYSKYRSQTMSGPNADGSRYVQADVPYVNYFYGDYAIHGNYWRPVSYFGNINSSHGCVGIRDPDSAWIYSWAPIGTPVIIHT